MADKKSLHTFNFLQNHVHRVSDDYADRLPLPEELINKNNNTEYWLFSDLYNLFGYPYVGLHNNIIDTIGTTIKFSDFQKLPQKNSDKVLRAPNFQTFYSGHVVSIINNYDIKNPNTTIQKQNGQDARLTRYACWSILKQWPNMIFSQLYFIMPDTNFETLYNTAYKFARLYQRAELTRAEKIVNGIAHRNKSDMRQFNSAMHRAFFYTADLDIIKANYGIKGTVFDYMGSRSLMMRQKALNKVINAYNLNPKMSFGAFYELLYQELVNARVSMINTTGRTPESDISRKSIGRIASELKKMEREFINKYAFQSLR